MRIAYFTNQYPATSHTFIRREIAALEARGHSVSRFAVRRAPGALRDPDDARELARTRHVLPLGSGALWLAACTLAASPRRTVAAARDALRFSAASKRGRLLHLAYFVEALIIAAWCRRDRVDHLHVHFGTNPATVGALAATLAGIPFSFTVHGPEEFDRAEDHSLRLKVARASFVAAVSSFGRSQLFRWAAPEDWSKIHIVHCGLDRAYLADAATTAATSRTLVCVARLSEQKGHFALLQAAAALRDRGVAFDLVLVGDGPLRPVVETAVRDLGLEGVVRLTGALPQPEVRRLIRLSRAMVLPSFAEGLPVVLMESMALRRPVISTYVAGIPELVRDDNGWLVPAGDSAALGEAMQAALAADKATLDRMGDRARRQVLARHDVAASARLIERHVMRGRSASAAQAGRAALGEAVPEEVGEDVGRRVAGAASH